MNDVSNGLKSYFKAKRMSQQAVAEKLGVSQAHVSSMLRGKPFGRLQAQKWQEAFGISAAWLLTGEGSMLVDSPVHHNDISIDLSGDAISTKGDNSPALGRGASLSTGYAEELADLRAQLKAKDDQIAALHKIIDKLTN